MMLTKLCMIAVLALSVALVLKQWKSDTLPLFRMALTLGFGIAALSSLSPVLSLLERLTSLSGAHGADLSLMLKALGIALLSTYCASSCRECGENAAADGVEIAGKIEILLLCLPLIEGILDAVSELLRLGGTAS